MASARPAGNGVLVTARSAGILGSEGRAGGGAGRAGTRLGGGIVIRLGSRSGASVPGFSKANSSVGAGRS